MGKLTDLQKVEIVEKYLSGSSGPQLAAEYGVRAQSIDSILKCRGIERRGCRKFSVNHAFFDIIDSEEKAYWLGYLFAEGSLDPKRNVIQVKIARADKDQLSALREALSATYEIKPDKYRDAVYIKISSKRIAEVLLGYRFGTGKAYSIRMPELRNDLVRHFIRGFFDGDGWVSKSDAGYLVGFASCSKPLLQSFQDWFAEQRGKPAGSIICRKRSHIPNQNDNFRLQYSGRASPLTILRLMYNEANVGLLRKWAVFLEASQ